MTIAGCEALAGELVALESDLSEHSDVMLTVERADAMRRRAREIRGLLDASCGADFLERYLADD